MGEKVLFSLGSNLGDREHNLKAGIEYAARIPGMKITGVSSFYRTEPVDNAGGPFFYNCAAEGEYEGSPYELLNAFEKIEKLLGRCTKGGSAPRELDIDIIFFGDWVLKSERLIIPHPRLYHRRFVLIPLNEIAPSFRCPVTGKKVSELLSETDDKSGVENVK